MALELAWKTGPAATSTDDSFIDVLVPYGTANSTDYQIACVWTLWWLKERLKDAGWTVHSCCGYNGTTFAVNLTGTDLWSPGTFVAGPSTQTSPASTASIIRPGGASFSNSNAPSGFPYYRAGQNHAWMCLKAPSSATAIANYCIVLDYDHAVDSGINSNIYNRISVVVIPSSGGAVGITTPGTITSRPLGTTDFGLFPGYSATNTGTQGASSTSSYGSNAPSMGFTFFDLGGYNVGGAGGLVSPTSQPGSWFYQSPHRVHFQWTTSGAFAFYDNRVGTGQLNGILAFVPLQNTHSVDQYPWVLLCRDETNVWGGNTGYRGYSFYWEGSGSITGRSYDGAQFQLLGAAIPSVIGETNATNASLFVHNGYNNTVNSSDGTYSDFPMIVVNTNGTPEIKGRIPDFTWTAFNIPQGAVTPPKAVQTDRYEKIKHYIMWLPWNSSKAPTL